MSINYQDYFEITMEGQVSLKEDFRGEGHEDYPASCRECEKMLLPEVLVIPNQIGTTEVTSLAPGMFYGNNRIKEITLPTTVQEVPVCFCKKAKNLRAVHGTNHIKSIGEGAFAQTRIKEALFPGLTALGASAFELCGYLETANIGTVSIIPTMAFGYCTLLREVIHEVIGEDDKVSIGTNAFRNTRSLRELPLLDYVSQVADGAFFSSRICTSLTAGGLIGAKAFPTFDNTTDFWTGVTFTPCRNRIVTKLSQNNDEWAQKMFLLDKSGAEQHYVYYSAGAIFAVMHIHSAITGKYYSHPDEFVEELKSNGLSKFLYYNDWPGQFDNVAPMLEALGYRTEVYGTDSNLSQEDYKALVDALAQGAYIYAQVGSKARWDGNWSQNKPDGGHAVVIYGINDLGEVCVLDSNVLHEPYRKCGFEQDVDIYTYTIPYQNIAGPGSDFVIVYPTRGESANAVTPACTPHGLPTGVNFSMISTATEWATLPEGKEGALTAYHLFSSPANAIEEWQPNGSSYKYVRYAKTTEDWSEWYVVDPKRQTPPA